MEEPGSPQIQRRKYAGKEKSEKNLCHAFGCLPDDYSGWSRKHKGTGGRESVEVYEYGAYGGCYGNV